MCSKYPPSTRTHVLIIEPYFPAYSWVLAKRLAGWLVGWLLVGWW